MSDTSPSRAEFRALQADVIALRILLTTTLNALSQRGLLHDDWLLAPINAASAARQKPDSDADLLVGLIERAVRAIADEVHPFDPLKSAR